jgi:two-component system, NtrC family, sensor kinase
LAVSQPSERLCDANDATIYQVDGGNLLLVAHHGLIPQSGSFPVRRGLVIGRSVLDRRTIHVADLQAEINEYPEGSDRARHLGHHTNLAVPVIHAGKAIGVISIRRTEVRPFTNRQIELLKTFADQAVIAIENTRLFEAEQTRTRELTDALEQQTATPEILRAISSAPAELAPVFKAILENATRLCGTKFGNLFLYEGGAFRTVAMSAPSSYPDHCGHENIPWLLGWRPCCCPDYRCCRRADARCSPYAQGKPAGRCDRNLSGRGSTVY